MVHAGALCRVVGAVHFHFFSGRHLYSNSSRKPFARTAHFHLPRLRALWLPAGVFSPGKFLARGSAAVESLERLRRSVSGRTRNVFSGASLDGGSAGGFGSRNRVCL